MKKYLSILVFILFYFFCESCADAQCTADTSCHGIGSSGNICPYSLDTGTVNTPYSQVITFIPPDSATVSSVTISICKIVLNSITNLPPGLSYASNPANGQFTVTHPSTSYCMLISGTPSTAGTYKLHISVTPYTLLASFCISTGQTFIDSSVSMIINLPTEIKKMPVNNISLNCSQNPFSNSTRIIYNAIKKDVVELIIHDMLGNVVYREKLLADTGENTFKFNGTKLHPGMYMYSVRDNKNEIVKKLIKSN